ncbi:DUF305 domain-containing protein [Novosphingobium sp.]|uniref:DUF305 domain-containing protein n=1 Tax=Novosphingobium sp. TaxID=1874826 RepID=UPI003340732E
MMHRYLTLAAILIAAPVAAQTSPQNDPGTMSGMNHGGMGGMKHDAMPKPSMPMPPAPMPAAPMPAMDHAKMQSMDHAKMETMDHPMMGGMGEMMKNTPANPYAEAGMAMHHKMMVVGAEASETWVRQMIEHHRGAIAMSKIAVAQANDKEARTMAQKDITMQEKDIVSLQSWLKRHGHTAQ